MQSHHYHHPTLSELSSALARQSAAIPESRYVLLILCPVHVCSVQGVRINTELYSSQLQGYSIHAAG